jgi:hypothetical protein
MSAVDAVAERRFPRPSAVDDPILYRFRDSGLAFDCRRFERRKDVPTSEAGSIWTPDRYAQLPCGSGCLRAMAAGIRRPRGDGDATVLDY